MSHDSAEILFTKMHGLGNDYIYINGDSGGGMFVYFTCFGFADVRLFPVLS